ncbi:MAG: hypothetical protein LBP83_05405, partial [Dysgonamonadaceae bacterium]|nr:hypothetical protein [Dysgonamonadaceae bacterium]
MNYELKIRRHFTQPSCSSTRLLVYSFTCLLFSVLPCFSQNGDTVLVKEKYFGTPMLKVLHDFETKYGMTLKYDSALVANYRF